MSTRSRKREYGPLSMPKEIEVQASNDTIVFPETEDVKMKSGCCLTECEMKRHDRRSVVLLLFLYLLQGIPLGLSASVPYILQTHKINYQTQATFSFVFWPFSLKLLWAPIIDSVYSSWLGRRKSWLIPIQYLIGALMLYLAGKIDLWLGNETGGVREVAIGHLTIMFFILNFLAASQDIVVDGWALTMLSRHNVGWASTCNTVGQTLGYFLAFVLLLAFDSPEFCNTWLRSEPKSVGLVTFSDSLYFWAIVFIVSTTLVLIFKSERTDFNRSESASDQNGHNASVVHTDGTSEELDTRDTQIPSSLWDTYRTMFGVILMLPVQQYVFTLFIIKIGFSAADSVTGLKLIELGVSKERLAFLGVAMVPIQTLLPLIISRYTAGPRPLRIFMWAALPRLLMGLVFAGTVCLSPRFQLSDHSYPLSYYVALFVIYGVYQLFSYSMFVSQMAFHAKVSDPAIGGTYMTLLNTASNLASNLPGTLVLYMVDPLTRKQCVGGDTNASLEACTLNGGSLQTAVDGYYIEIAVCFLIGLFGTIWRWKLINRLDSLSPNKWSYTVQPSRRNES